MRSPGLTISRSHVLHYNTLFQKSKRLRDAMNEECRTGEICSAITVGQGRLNFGTLERPTNGALFNMWDEKIGKTKKN